MLHVTLAAYDSHVIDRRRGVNYHRQFAVEVWPLTFERPAVPLPLAEFQQP